MVTVILGAEYDAKIRAALDEVLHELGGRELRRASGHAGSQELDSIEIEIAGQRLLVEAETYVGLSITGPAALVEKVQRLVKDRTGSSSR